MADKQDIGNDYFVRKPMYGIMTIVLQIKPQASSFFTVGPTLRVTTYDFFKFHVDNH